MADPSKDLPLTPAGRLSNSCLPISRLPPELLGRLMAGSLTFMDLTGENAISNIPHPHPCIDLSHVSRTWREVALGSPELWSRIQIHMRTKPEELEFIWKSSRVITIELEFWGHAYTRGSQVSIPRAFATISRILCDEMDHIKSLRTYCGVAPALRTLLAGVAPRAGALQTLELHRATALVSRIGQPPLEVGQMFLCGGTPKLQCIEATALTLPWSSSCFNSSVLTHVKLYEAAPGIDGFFELLKRAPQIKVLEVEWMSWRNDGELLPGGYPLIEMPQLERLSLGSYEWRSYGGLEDYLQCLVGLFGGAIAPEEMDLCHDEGLGTEAVKACMRHRVQWPDYGANTSAGIGERPTIMLEDREAWVQLAYGKDWIFGRPLSCRSMWSLENLRVITVGSGRCSDRLRHKLWASLGRLEKLELVMVDAKEHSTTLFQELDRRGNAVTSNGTFTFPSLRAIILTWTGAISETRSQEFEPGDFDDFDDDNDDDLELGELVEDILRALNKGGGRYLDELKVVFDEALDTLENDLARNMLHELENGGVARRIGVWDTEGEITWEEGVYDPIDYTA